MIWSLVELAITAILVVLTLLTTVGTILEESLNERILYFCMSWVFIGAIAAIVF